MAAVTRSEFADVCTTIENLGCMTIGNSTVAAKGRKSSGMSMGGDKLIKFNMSVLELENLIKTDPYLSLLSLK